MEVTLANIESYMHLFQDKNTQFGNPNWAEPIYAAMIRAYQNDEEIDVYIGNDYIRNMIEGKYTEGATYSPIMCIMERMGLEKVSNQTTDVMLRFFASKKAEDRKDLREYLQYMFLELMNNVVDHSHSSIGGYTCAQYFRRNKKIQFVIADRGIGFLENMKLNFGDIKTEVEAIFKGLEKGITSTKQTMYGAERNAGFGLYAMFEILNLTGGSFVIISNETLLRYTKDKFTIIPLEYAWKGVVVAFEFDESEINYDMDYVKRRFLWGDDISEEDDDFF